MIGEYNVTENSVYGWCFKAPCSGSPLVDVFFDDIFLRRIRCDSYQYTSSGQAIPEACEFHFYLADQLLDTLPTSGSIVVKDVDSVPLIIVGGMPDIGRAIDGGSLLRARLNDGWVVDKWGKLKLPFSAREERDKKSLEFYCDLASALRGKIGLNTYLCYGSLLGYVRESRLIPYDDDIDCGYISNYKNTRDVAAEFFDIKDMLTDICTACGYRVECEYTGLISIFSDDLHVDIFSSWIDQQYNYHCYFGVSGAMPSSSFLLKEVEFLGQKVLIPVDAERVLSWTYGPNWGVPDPHFMWRTPSEVTRLMEMLQEHGRIIWR